MAWLNATPKPPAGSKRAKAEQTSTTTRLQRMKRDGVEPSMPPNPAPQILARLLEIGITEAAGLGAGPLSWQTIQAWQDVLRVRLPRSEAQLLRRLSVEYLAEGRRAESENCPPPWRTAPTAREQEVELDQLRMVLG